MPYRKVQFAEGQYYHIYNRGVGRQPIFEEPTYLDIQAAVGISKHTGGYAATDELHRLCHLEEAQEVLDVGCGIGVGPAYIARQFDCQVMAVDISEKMLSWARQRARREGVADRFAFRKADVRELPFEDDTFDFAVSTEFIEHVPKKNAMDFLREVVRVTKKGGKVIITTPNNEWGEVDPVHPNEYSYDETLDMVSEVGLKTVDTYGLKLRGNVREWDKKFGKNAIWKSLRAAYPSIWAKCMLAAVLPEESIFWSLVAIKP